MAEFYHDLITEKSFKDLQDLRKKFKFILIGGWAVFLYAKSLKSKDIDLVLEFSELEKMRQKFPLSKNERLKKYEVRVEEVEIEILPNGEVRAKGQTSAQDLGGRSKPLTMREDLGGEYSERKG